MVQPRAFAGILSLLIVLASPAFAQTEAPKELRTWVLEDSSVVKGTLIEETPEGYRVKTAFGEVLVNKSDLKRPSAPSRRTRPLTKAHTTTVTYRGSTALVDLVAVVSVLASLNSSSGAPFLLSSLVYVAGVPLVHLTHDNPGVALGSLVLRIVLPIGGALISLMSSSGWWEAVVFAFGGALTGMLIPPIIDTAFLAKKTIRRTKPRFLSAMPSLSVTPKGTFTFGLTGHF